jgi:competence CoiA-like predicted nuclease
MENYSSVKIKKIKLECNHVFKLPSEIIDALPVVDICPDCKRKYVLEIKDGEIVATHFTHPRPLRHLAVHY